MLSLTMVYRLAEMYTMCNRRWVEIYEYRHLYFTLIFIRILSYKLNYCVFSNAIFTLSIAWLERGQHKAML